MKPLPRRVVKRTHELLCYLQKIDILKAENAALKAEVEKLTAHNSASKKCFGCSNYLPSCQHVLIPDSPDCKRNFEAYP